MKRDHKLTDHDLGEVDLDQPLPEFEAGAVPADALRLLVADTDRCERHTRELVRRVAGNAGTSTALVGMALGRIYREGGFLGVALVRSRVQERIPAFAVVFDNIVDAAEANGSPGEAIRNTLGAMAPNVRRSIVVGSAAILNAPSIFDIVS